MQNTQLLCTFCKDNELEETLKSIVDTYTVVFNSIYVLETVGDTSSLCCTYNVENVFDEGVIDLLDSTISLHRKKVSNTLYTINALNLLVQELNNGVIDKSFKIPWENYTNTILVTAYGKLKKIPTKLRNIVDVNELN